MGKLIAFSLMKSHHIVVLLNYTIVRLCFYLFRNLFSLIFVKFAYERVST